MTIKIINVPGRFLKEKTIKCLAVYYQGIYYNIKIPDKNKYLSWSTIHQWGHDQIANYPLSGDTTCSYKQIEIHEYETAA
jgi:hypothetical protein